MQKKIFIISTMLFSSIVFSEDYSKMFPGNKPSKDCEAIYNEVLEEAKSGKYWYTHVEMINSSPGAGKVYCNMRLHGYDKNRGRHAARPIQEVVELKKNHKQDLNLQNINWQEAWYLDKLRIRGVTVNRRPFLLPGAPSKSYIDLSIVDFDGWRSVYHVARWGRSVISALPSSSLLRVDGEQRAPR